MGATTLLLLFTVTLTKGALGLWPEETNPPLADWKNDWPCPEANDIQPCKCFSGVSKLELDCSKITSSSELESVFKKHFPIQNFTLLIIIANPGNTRVPITSLSENIFQNITFTEIRISHTDLSYIHLKVFDNSLPFIETLIVTDSFITMFPFDLVDSAPLLTDLRVFRNHIVHMPEMTSKSLKYLHISYNHGLQYGDHALENLPNLEYFLANDIRLSHVAPNEFYSNKKLKYLDLSHNNLETLYKDSLKFDSPIQEIYLNSNKIHRVEMGAISGLGTTGMTVLYMHNNTLETIQEAAWEPVFSSVITNIRVFTFSGNPLLCQCDILWLVNNTDHRDTIARGAYCKETDTDVLSINVPLLISLCT